MRTRARSVLGRKTCICPAKNLSKSAFHLFHRTWDTYRARYPSPLKEKLLCPLGKLLQPSWSVCSPVSVQIVIVTREFIGVPFAGLHLAIRSGLGRPTEFLTTSVRNEVKIRLMKSPSIVTCTLCPPGLSIAAQAIRTSNGIPPPYTNSHTAIDQRCAMSFIPGTIVLYLAAPSPRVHGEIESQCHLERTCDEMDEREIGTAHAFPSVELVPSTEENLRVDRPSRVLIIQHNLLHKMSAVQVNVVFRQGVNLCWTNLPESRH